MFNNRKTVEFKVPKNTEIVKIKRVGDKITYILDFMNDLYTFERPVPPEIKKSFKIFYKQIKKLPRKLKEEK
jgi:hypothetical protein